MIRTLSGIVSGSLRATPQDHSRASLAPILRKRMAISIGAGHARTIHNRVRAFNPWPGTVTQFRGGLCRILKSRVGRPLEGRSLRERFSASKGYRLSWTVRRWSSAGIDRSSASRQKASVGKRFRKRHAHSTRRLFRTRGPDSFHDLEKQSFPDLPACRS